MAINNRLLMILDAEYGPIDISRNQLRKSVHLFDVVYWDERPLFGFVNDHDPVLVCTFKLIQLRRRLEPPKILIRCVKIFQSKNISQRIVWRKFIIILVSNFIHNLCDFKLHKKLGGNVAILIEKIFRDKLIKFEQVLIDYSVDSHKI